MFETGSHGWVWRGCGGGVWLQEVGGCRWALGFIAKDHFLTFLCLLVHHNVKSSPGALVARPSCPWWSVPSNCRHKKSLILSLIWCLDTATALLPQLLGNQMCFGGATETRGPLWSGISTTRTYFYLHILCMWCMCIHMHDTHIPNDTRHLSLDDDHDTYTDVYMLPP